MSFQDPITKDKTEYSDVIAKIASGNSPVGIDAQYTHAVIIDYLQQISRRLERVEAVLAAKK